MIYFIECVDRIKIGFSGAPLRRLVKITADAPYPATLLGVMDGGFAEELAIHEAFRDDRRHGEWFNGSIRLRDFIQDNAGPISRPVKPPVSKLDKFIRDSGMKDAEFGEKIGVSQSQVSRIKNGKTAPSLAVIVAIEKATRGKVGAGDILAAVKQRSDTPAIEAAE
jgi:hypothetical protein